MDTLKRFGTVVFVVVGIVLAVLAPIQAQAADSHGFGGGHPGGARPGMGGFEGHHRFDGHHGVRRGVHGRVFFGYPFYGYYAPFYGYSAPGYWYYCPSYGDYYPNVTSCPESWVPVPAS